MLKLWLTQDCCAGLLHSAWESVVMAAPSQCLGDSGHMTAGHLYRCCACNVSICLETHQEQLHPKLTFNLAEVSLHMSAAVCVLPACLKRFHGCSRQSYGRTAICDVCLAVWI